MARAIARPEGSLIVQPRPHAEGVRTIGKLTHPWAWWAWAIGAAAAVSMTTNPLMIALVVAAVVMVVLVRRTDSPWARSVGAYFALALTIVAIRVVFMIIFGGQRSGVVLFNLPQIALPKWAAGISLGGPVTLNAVLGALYDGFRLAAMIVCVGAANALANPRRALRSVPAALHDLSVAIVIALSVAPQLVESLHRVRKARRLRGGAAKGWRAVGAVLVPVLEDAIDRSLMLATGMEARGYGRTRDQARVSRGAGLLLIAALMVLVFGVYVLLGVPQSGYWGHGLIALGAVAVVAGMRNTGRRLAVTRYRPDVWTWREWTLVAAGLAAAGLAYWLQTTHTAMMAPTTRPLVWPQLHPVMVVIAALLASAAVTTHAPPVNRTNEVAS